MEKVKKIQVVTVIVVVVVVHFILYLSVGVVFGYRPLKRGCEEDRHVQRDHTG